MLIILLQLANNSHITDLCHAWAIFKAESARFSFCSGILLVFLVRDLDCFVLYFFADAVLYSNVPLFIFIFHSVHMSLKQEIEMSNHSIISLNSIVFLNLSYPFINFYFHLFWIMLYSCIVIVYQTVGKMLRFQRTYFHLCTYFPLVLSVTVFSLVCPKTNCLYYCIVRCCIWTIENVGIRFSLLRYWK